MALGGGDGDLRVGMVMWGMVMWGGGDTAMGGGDAALGGGDADVDSWDFCLFFQRRRVGGESGGGIGITGEPARCTVSVFFC